MLYDTQHPRMLDKLDSNSTTPASREWGVGGSLSCPLYYEPRGSSYSNSTTPASRQGGGWVGVYPVLYIMNHVIHHIPTPLRLLAGNGGGGRSLSCPLDYEPCGSSYSNSTTPASREGWGVGGSLSCPLYYEPRGSSYSNTTMPASR